MIFVFKLDYQPGKSVAESNLPISRRPRSVSRPLKNIRTIQDIWESILFNFSFMYSPCVCPLWSSTWVGRGKTCHCLHTAAPACLQYFPATLKLLKKELGPTPCYELCVTHLWSKRLHDILLVPVLPTLHQISASNGSPFRTGSLRLGWKLRCFPWTQIPNWFRDSVLPQRYHNLPIFFFSMGSLPLQAFSSTLYPEDGKFATDGWCVDYYKTCLGITIQLHSNEGPSRAASTTSLQLALFNHCSLFSSFWLCIVLKVQKVEVLLSLLVSHLNSLSWPHLPSISNF